MERTCEICAALARSREPIDALGSPPGKLRRIRIEARIVALCENHLAPVLSHKPTTIAELRSLFKEARGSRSLLSRRSPLDRRVFPARPEGRRRSGRRTSDTF